MMQSTTIGGGWLLLIRLDAPTKPIWLHAIDSAK